MMQQQRSMDHSYKIKPENICSSALNVVFGFAVVVFVLWALYLLYKLLVWGYSVVDMVPCQLEVGYYLLGLGLDGL